MSFGRSHQTLFLPLRNQAYLRSLALLVSLVSFS